MSIASMEAQGLNDGDYQRKLERELLELQVYKHRREQPTFDNTRHLKVTIEEEGKNSVTFPFDFLTHYDEPENIGHVLTEVAKQAIAAFVSVIEHEWALFDDDPGSAFNLSQKYEVSE